MSLKAVFFDLDDTLYGSFKACDRQGYAYIAAYAERELGVSGEMMLQAFADYRAQIARMQPGKPPIHDRVVVAQGALESLGLNAVRHARAVHRAYWQGVFDTMELREGVPELLRELRAAGIKTAVVTDMLSDIQMEKLELLGLADEVDYLVSSEQAGQDKPAPQIFWLALQKCGCLPEEAVMVGDNFVHDVQGALDCGIPGIWLNWNDQPQPTDRRAYTEVKTFAQVAAQVRGRLASGG